VETNIFGDGLREENIAQFATLEELDEALDRLQVGHNERMKQSFNVFVGKGALVGRISLDGAKEVVGLVGKVVSKILLAYDPRYS